MLAEQVLDALEDHRIDDSRLLTVMDLVLVADLPHIGDVAQQAVQTGAREGLAAAGRAFARLPALAEPAAAIQFLHHWQQRSVLQVQGEDRAHPVGFFGIDGEASALGVEVIAQEGVAAGPLALAAGGGDLVARPLGDQLALELGKGQQHIENQPPHRRRGAKLLRHTHEGDLVLFKDLHQSGEIE
jgi:hypothetical protein